MKPRAASTNEKARSTPKSSGRKPRHSKDEIVAMADVLGDDPSVDSVQEALGGGGRDRIIEILAQRRIIKGGSASHGFIPVSIAKAINAHIEAVRQDVANELKEAYEAVEEERETFRRDAREVRNLCDELQQSVVNLKAEGDQLRGRLAGANEGASEHKAELAALQARFADQHTSIAQLTTERDGLLDRLLKAESDCEAAQRRIAVLTEDLAKSRETEARAQGELAGYIPFIAHWERQQRGPESDTTPSPSGGLP